MPETLYKYDEAANQHHLHLVEARYMAVMEDQTSLVVGFAANGEIRCVSRGFTYVLNSSEQSLLGMNLFTMIYPDDLPGLNDALQNIQRGRAISRELRLGIAGSMIKQKWDIRGIYVQDQLVEYQATGRVISGDLMTKAQLQDGSVFRRLTENIPVMLYLFGSRKFLYVNRSFEKKFGYKHMELLNMDFWELVHPDYRERVKRRGLAILEGHDPVPANGEIKGITKDGSLTWTDVFVNIIDLNGETVGLVAGYDITERKRLEEALKQAHRELENRVQKRTAELRKTNQELTTLNNNLNNIVQNMSDGVLLFNRDGQVKILNPGFEKAWGQTVHNWRGFVNMNYFQKKVFEEGVFLQDEEFFVPSTRGQAHFVASASPIADEQGEVTGCLVLVRPIERVHRLVHRFTGAHAHFHFEDIITLSPKMYDVIANARKAASNRSIVLIEGESGTGKEMFAHAIHNDSPRAQGPFVALNCAAIPRDLVGSEMFGYEEGAFTGAKRGGSPGRFELASGGTLFLDEIGDMPLEQQAILLRVIQEQKLTRIGGNQLIPVDVRIICATNKDLWEAVQAGTFRQDLYYRLNVINLKIPPLRERAEDIPLLLEHYYQKTAASGDKRPEEFDQAALQHLLSYQWPGNVRELQNLVEKVLHAANPANKLTDWMRETNSRHTAGTNIISNSSDSWQTKPSIRQIREQQKQAIKEQESAYIIELLDKYRGNISKVALEMGIARSTLYKKMNDYHISDD